MVPEQIYNILTPEQKKQFNANLTVARQNVQRQKVNALQLPNNLFSRGS